MRVGWLPDRHFTSPGVTKSEIALLFDGIIMCVTAASVLLCLFTLALTSDISKESLDSVHLPHSPIKEAHFENGEHNIEYDHDAVLGSHDLHDEFDELSEKEKRTRFSEMIDRMDSNNDGYVARDELSNWVHMSFINLNKEEAIEKMARHDLDHNEHVTITEYLQEVYDYSIEEIYDMEKDKNPEVRDLAKMMFGDVEKFRTADRDGNGVLDKAEYPAFIHPYDYDYMHQVELKLMLRQYDRNNDGVIDFKEYMSEPGQAEPGKVEEQILIDQENFNLYDTDENGTLDVNEIKSWAIPDYKEASEDEAEHLIGLTDKDNDNKLTKEEIIAKQELWVGSSATNYGDDLHDPSEL